jgi:hypothetical protein
MKIKNKVFSIVYKKKYYSINKNILFTSIFLKCISGKVGT